MEHPKGGRQWRGRAEHEIPTDWPLGSQPIAREALRRLRLDRSRCNCLILPVLLPRPSYKLDGLLLALLGIPLLASIGTFPAWWDSIVGFALFPQVNHVIEGSPLAISWVWQDMYQHNAGASPLYSALIVPGLRVFGLELIAARLPVALLCWASLAYFYLGLRRWFEPGPARLWLVLLATCSWYLVFARSGGIVAFGLSLTFLAHGILLQLAAQAEEDVSNKWIQALAGAVGAASVVALTYAHTSTRLWAIVLAAGVPFARQLFSKPQRLGFVVGLVLLLSVQLQAPREALTNYFNSRGETLFAAMAARSDGTWSGMATFALGKVSQNCLDMARLYLGLNEWPQGFFAAEVESHWRPDVLLFPRWLVPFFLLGLIALARLVWRSPRSGSSLLLFYGLVSAMPGFLCGVGDPNAARLLLHLPVVYACITFGLWSSLTWLRLPSVRRSLTVVCAAVVAVAQVYNFFGYERGDRDDRYRSVKLWEEIQLALAQSPEVVVVAQEFPDFRLESFVTLRWLGGERLSEWRRAGRVVLLTTNNVPEVEQLIRDRLPLLFVTEAVDDLSDKFPRYHWKVEKDAERVVWLKPYPLGQVPRP